MHGSSRRDKACEQRSVSAGPELEERKRPGGAHASIRRTDKKILIPLTSSLYVPGRIKDTENVIVDVGTGYFVEKVRSPPPPSTSRPAADSPPLHSQSAKAAKTLFNSKILELRKNLATLQEQIERKNDNARAVGEVLRIKLSKERQKGGAQGGGPQQD